MAQLEQERAEAEARREIVVVAPHDGTVTAIHAVPGAKADTGTPLLSIVPLASRLEAHLYAPSRAIGFVRPGQRVLLRYQAFPYQRFGHYEGVVAAVSRAALSPAELPAQLAGLKSLTAAAEPSTIGQRPSSDRHGPARRSRCSRNDASRRGAERRRCLGPRSLYAVTGRQRGRIRSTNRDQLGSRLPMIM
jgi:hypothetical protein